VVDARVEETQPTSEAAMKFLLKLVILIVVVAGGAAVYVFWDDLTPGEKYHLVDKARSGDVDGLTDSVKHKAGEHVDRTKKKAADAIQDLSNKAVDAAAEGAKKGIDSAASDAKKNVQSQVEAELKASEKAAVDKAAAEASGVKKPGG
jgi:hypothetical protein